MLNDSGDGCSYGSELLVSYFLQDNDVELSVEEWVFVVVVDLLFEYGMINVEEVTGVFFLVFSDGDFDVYISDDGVGNFIDDLCLVCFDIIGCEC